MTRLFAITHLAAALLLALTACSCAHMPPSSASDYPATTSSFGVIARVAPHREVVCVIDDQLHAADCDVIADAIREINEAVGFELLSAPRHVTVEEARFMVKMDPAMDRDVTIIMGGELPPGTLGVTQFGARHGEALGQPIPAHLDTLIHTVMIAFVPGIFSDVSGVARHVVLHELLHSVGCMHAEQATTIDSIMVPYFYSGAVSHLTPSDVATLRAAYRK